MVKGYHNGAINSNAKSHKLFAKFARATSRIYKTSPLINTYLQQSVMTYCARTFTSVLLMCLLLFTLSVHGATEFWVSPDGNDKNPGTSARPFASIAHAEERAHTLRLEK